jgi:hypothetical protein
MFSKERWFFITSTQDERQQELEFFVENISRQKGSYGITNGKVERENRHCRWGTHFGQKRDTLHFRPAVSLGMADCFDFDCPRNYVDLNEDPGEGDSNWFSVVHLMHENSPFNQKSSSTIEGNPTFPKTVVPLVQFTKKHVTSDQTKRKVGHSLTKIDQSPSKKKSRVSARGSADENEKEMLILLRKHNEKFTPTTKYEPSRHSVRDVRKWEKISGKEWCALAQEERILANDEIMRMKNK